LYSILNGIFMSRIGKKPVAIPQGVKVEQSGQTIKIKGPLGELSLNCHPKIRVKIDGSVVCLENENRSDKFACQLHGTMRALVANMIEGVTKGYQKRLLVFGTGYNVKVQADKLILQVGFCSPAEVKIPEGIKVNIETAATKGDEVPAAFAVSGVDKAVVGQLAAQIRNVSPPEPYKGKGIRFADEHIRRKVGKSFTSGAST
jgi:large subunit ribosomal protein L6